MPVLLSVMTMALLHSNKMPSSLFELYDAGLKGFFTCLLRSFKEVWPENRVSPRTWACRTSCPAS